MKKIVLIWTALLILVACSDSHQQAVPNFVPKNTQKTFSDNARPVVLVDEAHHNFLTASGRYAPFVKVLKSDGYTVKRNANPLSNQSLRDIDILVIANALDKNRTNWTPPFTHALSSKEVTSIKDWIVSGGSLLLIADHTPFPRIIENLADELGFKFSHGHVDNAVFRLDHMTLTKHVITTHVREHEAQVLLPSLVTDNQKSTTQTKVIQYVKTFGGSAFKAPPEAVSLLTLGENAVSVVPQVPFQIDANTPRESMHGWSQGAVLTLGKGRVAVFAEGMMFSSQYDARTKKTYGLNSKGAKYNEAFLLNVMSWLAGVI